MNICTQQDMDLTEFKTLSEAKEQQATLARLNFILDTEVWDEPLFVRMEED